MLLDSLLVGVMLFSSFAIRTPNVEPNPDDYEVSVGLSHPLFSPMCTTTIWFLISTFLYSSI